MQDALKFLSIVDVNGEPPRQAHLSAGYEAMIDGAKYSVKYSV